ncbi:hypothetical protein L2E82_51991 [Cichorium intybus]|nr:hypothetical protein L2E82_51991 [Cichorium intybus]
MAIAQNFPCTGPATVERLDIFCATCKDYIVDGCIPCVYRLLIITLYLVYLCLMLLLYICRMIVTPFIKETVQIHDNAMELLEDVCRLTNRTKHSNSFHHYYTNPVLEAAKQNSYEVVQLIVYAFPNAIFSANEDGHNVIQYAVINRSEKVYNLLYQMSEHRNIYRTIKDSSGNNLLHLAARLAPSNKLNLISGAALQIQRELQWFTEVEGFVCPLSIIQKNSSGETPKMYAFSNLLLLPVAAMKAVTAVYALLDLLDGQSLEELINIPLSLLQVPNMENRKTK